MSEGVKQFYLIIATGSLIFGVGFKASSLVVQTAYNIAVYILRKVVK